MHYEFNPTTASPEDYLAYLQYECASSEYMPRTVLSYLEELDKRIEKKDDPMFSDDLESHYETGLNRAEIEKPTRLEDPAWHAVLGGYIQAVVQVIGELNLQLVEGLVFGSLPTGEMNAMAIRVPSGGKVIAINQGTIPFIHLQTTTIAPFIALGKKGELLTLNVNSEDMEHLLDTNKESCFRFAEALFSYVVLREARYSSEYLLPTLQRIITRSLGRSALLFIVAHEYSHIVLGHLEGSIKRRLMGKVEVEEILRNWEDEISADALAFKIVAALNPRTGFDFSLPYLGIDFFFSCMEIVDQLIGASLSTSHPPVSIRQEGLRIWIGEKLPNQTKELLEIGAGLQKLVAELWIRSRPRVREFMSIYSEMNREID